MAGKRYKIKDIVSLYSRVQWEKKLISLNDEDGIYWLFVPSQSDGIRLDVRMLKGEMPTQNGFILVLKSSFIEEVDPYYLCFEMMSIVGNIVLLYDKEKRNYKSRITKRELSVFEIEVPEMEHQLVLRKVLTLLIGLSLI